MLSAGTPATICFLISSAYQVTIFFSHKVKVNSAKLQKYRKFVDENYREPVDGKFADDTERILKLIGAQNAGPGEDDDDEDIGHESDQ